ncbi:MAG: Rrf2 family transcriptional regulator [Proteobacteria bacterium]|nr:Rrf2 family transcriptional regulator [Pseudomonadota bacterium]MBU1596181.1 Rrf2 family transcriptional regulator [Pseudomonadota bacterium]
MRLSTKSRYGTRMLLDIAEHCHSGPVSVAEIASRTGISEKYMEKLIRRLKRAGLVFSKRGPKGGHVLAKSAAHITMGEVVRALEDCVVLKDCRRGKESCTTCDRQTHCPSKIIWEQASVGMFQMLDAYTLQNLLTPDQDADGSMRRLLDARSPMKKAEGEAVAAMEMFLGSTSRKELKNGLGRHERNYLAAIRDIPDPMFVLEAESLRILDCNQSVQQVYGFEQSELLGKSFLDLFREEERASYRRKLTRQEPQNRVVHVAKGGREFFVSVRVSPSELSGQKVLLVTTSDMTRRMESERQLIQTAKMATLGEMATGMAHELNQPLSVIKTAAGFLRGKVERGEELAKDILGTMVVEIDAHVDRATKIVNHLREFGRKPEMRLEPVDVGDILLRALDIFSQQLKQRGIEVVQDVESGLPLVLADAGRLEQVFINMLVNARDAIEEKWRIGQAAQQPDGPKRISLSARRQGLFVEVDIADTGCGISPGVQEKIFEPFFTTKEVGKGTGLGLSISYGIIKDCGGDIHVESRPGEGARFSITLPTAPAADTLSGK